MREGFVHYNVTLRPELDREEILAALFSCPVVLEEIRVKQRVVVEQALAEWLGGNVLAEPSDVQFEMYRDGTCCWTYKGELLVTFGSHFQNHSPWWVSQSYVVFDRYVAPGPNLEKHLYHEGHKKQQ